MTNSHLITRLRFIDLNWEKSYIKSSDYLFPQKKENHQASLDPQDKLKTITVENHNRVVLIVPAMICNLFVKI